MGADGTVTYIDGNRIYAFGHRFLDVGATSLPFARSEVIALVPNLNTSFKLSAPRMDGRHRSGPRHRHFGRTRQTRRHWLPVSISVSRGATPVESYRMQMVNDPLLSPLLLQMAVFSAIDATERTVGAATLRITGEVDFQNAPAPVRIDNMFTADNGSAMHGSPSAAIPVAYVMQSGFDSLRLKKAAIHIEAFDQRSS